VAVVLSAQATDRSVNIATRKLFAAAPTPEAMVTLGEEGIAEHIKTIGLFRNKAKNTLALSRLLLERHGGEVPASREALEALPGVGRKTANVVLGEIWNRPDGVVVDTHVSRIALKLGLTDTKDPVKAERQLNEVLPQQDWRDFTHMVIDHGRATCRARTPKCDACPLYRWCETRA